MDEVRGPDHAAALMTAYPPMPWSDVAIAITSQTRAMVFAVVGAMLANASLTIGALALTR